MITYYLPYGVVTASAPDSGQIHLFITPGVTHQSLYFFKLVVKPYSLLLEDRRSKTSSDGHNQTSVLPLFFDLALKDMGKAEKAKS